MSIECCLFDLGNVLVFFSHDRMVQNVAELIQSPVAEVRNFLFDQGWQERLETGQCSQEEFHRACQQIAGVTVSQTDLLQALSDIFELNAPMVPLLQELKQAGLRLVLLSNTCQAHIEWVREKWDFLTLFDDVTTSWQAGALKPARRIYADAISRAGCPAAHCFYTDDIQAYVSAARELEIQAHLFENADQTRQVLTSLSCLPAGSMGESSSVRRGGQRLVDD